MKNTKNNLDMTIIEEVNVWIYFWLSAAFIFMVLYYSIELYYYLKNKK